MERSFAREADAVLWCNVMSEAEPQATGVWFVALARGGRMMSITRDAGLLTPLPAPPPAGVAGAPADELGTVLATAGMPAGPGLTAQRVSLDPVGSA